MNDQPERTLADVVDEWAEGVEPDHIIKIGRALAPDEIRALVNYYGRRDWTVAVPADLLGHLIEIAKHAKAYEDAQPDRQWRIGDPNAQWLHEALMDLDQYTAQHGNWLEEVERAIFDADD